MIIAQRAKSRKSTLLASIKRYGKDYKVLCLSCHLCKNNTKGKKVSIYYNMGLFLHSHTARIENELIAELLCTPLNVKSLGISKYDKILKLISNEGWIAPTAEFQSLTY